MYNMVKMVNNRIRDIKEEFGLGGGFKKKYFEYEKPGNYLLLKIHWLLMLAFEYGVSAEDFFVYHFYEKSKKERKEGRNLYHLVVLDILTGCLIKNVEENSLKTKDYLE